MKLAILSVFLSLIFLCIFMYYFISRIGANDVIQINKLDFTHIFITYNHEYRKFQLETESYFNNIFLMFVIRIWRF